MAEPQKSFWTTLPGILTGIAGILSGVGAVLAVVLNAGGGDKGPQVTLANWAKQANEICATANDDMRALGVGSDPAAQFRLIPQATRIVTRANQKIEALDRPADAEAQIRRLVGLASQSNVAAGNAYQAYLRGDTASGQAYQAASARASDTLRRLDGDLGANVCAQGP
jgi:hypothetical protein